MRKIKTLVTSTVMFVVFGLFAQAYAGKDFTSHHLVEEKPYKGYVEQLSGKEKLEIREYLNYEQREPCQFYQPVPEGFVKQGCEIVREGAAQSVRSQRNVVANYEVNFAFDSAAIGSAASTTLERVVREIEMHKPGEVTIAGHADRSGSSDYNVILSQKRAEAVSDALTARGVANRVLDTEAYGESNPEVFTPDGVRNAQNRRVEIQFLK